jgi:hypothetical protein
MMPIMEKIHIHKYDHQQEHNIENKDERFYVLGKDFKFHNIFMKFYTNKRDSKMMRMVDYDFVATHLENIQDLNIINFLIHKRKK